MRLRDLPGTIGAEVLDFALASVDGTTTSLMAGEVDALREAFDVRHLLLLRGPVVAGHAQTAFVARFGPLLAERNLWGYVSNVRDDGIVREGALLFHSDFAFTVAPVFAISLHALDVPAGGTATLFADAAGAARRLPSDLRKRLTGRSVLNIYDFHRPNDQPMRLAEVDPRSPRYEHSVIAAHPRTGVEVIMANEMHTDHIIGVSKADSDALLADLFAVLYDEANVFEHRWTKGDVLLWDNIALHHGRRDVHRDEPRTLQRVTLGLYTADELVPNLAELLASSSG